MGEGDSTFHREANVVTDGGINLSKYKSESTGITVFIAEADGPVVAGYLCFATEAEDDCGLPHTLEHLVFMGSELYPYKGVLDLIANRCLASGTNAWTDIDHTCYTMYTAGHEGFLQLLPIYIDHLLYPTLTDSAFITEVHHINPEGEDAGVVYSEMQARENTGESRCHLAMLRAMYPGDCGYRYETGGILKELRECTTNVKVRSYHEKFYRPENLCIIIVGQIEPQKVFQVLQPIEERILSKGLRTPFVRPWQKPVSPLASSEVIDIKYPSDEEEYGLTMVAWRGPLATEFVELASIEILMEYLIDTSISPLQREFVETAVQYCNTIGYATEKNSVTCMYLHFLNVPVKMLGLIKDRLFDVLGKIADGTEPLDMKRMETVIRKNKLCILSEVESDPHRKLALYLIDNFLYGNAIEDLQQRVQQILIIDKLIEKTEEYWINLLKTYLLDGYHIVVNGHPSRKFAEEMTVEEQQRIEEQKLKLGLSGLRHLEDILRRAVRENEVQPPDDLVSSISVPSVESIKFHSIERSSNQTADRAISVEGFDIMKMPCLFQLDIVRSNFVRMYVMLDTSEVPLLLRMFLPLYVELVTESSICRNCEILPYQEVVKQLAEDTVSISTALGMDYSRFFCVKYAQVVCLELMVEEECYLQGVQWIRELLYQIVFEPARIKKIASKMISDVATLKRSGNSVMKTIMKNLIFMPESNHWTASMLRQFNFLSELIQTLDTDSQKVVDALTELQALITQVDRITVHVSANIPTLRQKHSPEEPWVSEFLPPNFKPEIKSTSIKQCSELVRDFSSSDIKSVITGIASVESSFLLQCAPCINSYTNSDYPALLVLIQYLIQLEGPMWRQIRGMGLAYDYSIFLRPNEGLIYFSLFKATQLVQAYKGSLNIIESHLNHAIDWDLSLLESACSSLAYNIVRKERTISSVTLESLVSYYKGIDLTFTKSLLKSIFQVTTADMERVGATYLKPLFNSDLSRCAICCHPSKVDDVVLGFKQFSRELTVVPSLEDSFMSTY